MLSSDQGPRNASGGLKAAGLTSRPRFGAGATVDRGLPASKYAPVKLILALMSYMVLTATNVRPLKWSCMPTMEQRSHTFALAIMRTLLGPQMTPQGTLLTLISALPSRKGYDCFELDAQWKCTQIQSRCKDWDKTAWPGGPGHHFGRIRQNPRSEHQSFDPSFPVKTTRLSIFGFV